jgi:hypothetical protein
MRVSPQRDAGRPAALAGLEAMGASGPAAAASGPNDGERGSGVRAGPLHYRRRIRTLGPFVALVPPAVALGIALLVWRLYPCSGTACVSSGAAGWLLAALALPTSLVVGMPWEGGTSRYALMVITSAALWVVLGWLAARRATQSPVASWRDWWREYAWFLVGVWAGVLAALGILVYVVQHHTFL